MKSVFNIFRLAYHQSLNPTAEIHPDRNLCTIQKTTAFQSLRQFDGRF